jgi:hypothetical protein
MKKLVVITLVTIGLFSGCSKVQRIPFPVEEYEKLPKIESGTAIVKGQAFLRTMIGEVRYAAGSEVMLNPITSYSRQWYTESYLPSRLIADADPRLWDYVVHTQADAEGRFEFRNVPAGEYYAVTKLIWYVPGSYAPQGGVIAKPIKVKEGQELNVILTR